MNQANGFTLIEMLAVLSIYAILILLSAPIMVKTFEAQQEKQFLKTFEFDLLYAQNLSTQSKNNIRINFDEDQYTILSDNEVITSRMIPENWHINLRVIKNIGFDENGRIKEPGTMSIKTRQSEYVVVFPFGKGRGYIVKQ